MMKSFLEAPSPSPKRPLRTGARARPLSEGMGEAILESTPRESQRWQGGTAPLFGLALCLLPVPAAHFWGVYVGPVGDASGVLYMMSLAVTAIISIGAAITFVAAYLLWNGIRIVLHWRSRS